MNAQNQMQVYNMWLKLSYFKQFKRDYMEKETHQKTGFKVFWRNVCDCCRFGKRDMCSDLIMSGLEEASRGIENATKSDVRLLEQIRACKCAYHRNKSLEKETAQSGANSSINNEVGDSRSVSSDEGEYDFLYDCSRQNHDKSSNNTEVDDSSSISSADSDTDFCENSINLCKRGDEMWKEGGCLIEDLVQKQGEDQICKTCCPAQQHPELTRYSIFGDSSSEKIIPS
jgi:hypothetical protein